MTPRIDGRTRRRKLLDAVAPMYPSRHVIYGDIDPEGWDGRGRRAEWRFDVRTVAIGYSIITRREQRDQGMTTEGWHLTLYLGPVTVELHGADSVEDDYA